MNYAKLFADIANKIRELAGIPQQLTGIRQSIEEQGEATRSAYERNQKEEDEQWRRVEVLFDDQEIGKSKANQDRHDRIQKSIKNAAWGTFGAAAIYGAITLLLWLNARDQLEMEQRAWLVFDPSYADTIDLGEIGSDVAVPVRLENIGKTPTMAIEGFVIVEELTKDQQPTFIYHTDRATPIRVGILYPGTEYAQTTQASEFSGGHKAVSITDEKGKQFRAGRIFFNVWGRLSYVDIFQHPHWVQFCHAVAQIPSGKTKTCADYNLVDTPSRWAYLNTIFRR